MGTVDLFTTGSTLDWPAHGTVTRSPTTGSLWLFTRFNTTDTYRIYTSSNGAVWSLVGAFSRANLIEWSSLVVDRAGRYVHLAYRVSNTTDDRLFYRRFTIQGLSWSAELQVSGTSGSGDANGGTPGAFWQGVDLAVVRNSNDTFAIAVVGTNNYPG